MDIPVCLQKAKGSFCSHASLPEGIYIYITWKSLNDDHYFKFDEWFEWCGKTRNKKMCFWYGEKNAEKNNRQKNKTLCVCVIYGRWKVLCSNFE